MPLVRLACCPLRRRSAGPRRHRAVRLPRLRPRQRAGGRSSGPRVDRQRAAPAADPGGRSPATTPAGSFRSSGQSGRAGRPAPGGPPAWRRPDRIVVPSLAPETGGAYLRLARALSLTADELVAGARLAARRGGGTDRRGGGRAPGGDGGARLRAVGAASASCWKRTRPPCAPATATLVVAAVRARRRTPARPRRGDRSDRPAAGRGAAGRGGAPAPHPRRSDRPPATRATARRDRRGDAGLPGEDRRRRSVARTGTGQAPARALRKRRLSRPPSPPCAHAVCSAAVRPAVPDTMVIFLMWNDLQRIVASVALGVDDLVHDRQPGHDPPEDGVLLVEGVGALATQMKNWLPAVSDCWCAPSTACRARDGRSARTPPSGRPPRPAARRSPSARAACRRPPPSPATPRRRRRPRRAAARPPPPPRVPPSSARRPRSGRSCRRRRAPRCACWDPPPGS